MRNGAEAKRPYFEKRANALTRSTKTGRGTGHKGLGGPILGNARAPKGLYFAAWGGWAYFGKQEGLYAVRVSGVLTVKFARH